MRELHRRLKQLESIVGVKKKKIVIRYVSISLQSEREKYQKEHPDFIWAGETETHGRMYDQWRDPNRKDIVIE